MIKEPECCPTKLAFFMPSASIKSTKLSVKSVNSNHWGAAGEKPKPRESGEYIRILLREHGDYALKLKIVPPALMDKYYLDHRDPSSHNTFGCLNASDLHIRVFT